jgi:gas vesicle protein
MEMQDAILNELLDGQYAAARDRFAEGQHSHEDLTIIMLKHQTNHIAHLDQDVHAKIDKLDVKIQDVKDALKSEIKEVKDSLKSEVKEVKDSLKSEVKEVKDSLKSEVKEVKDSLEAKIDGLRKDINNQTWRMIFAIGLMTSLFTFVMKF